MKILLPLSLSAIDPQAPARLLRLIRRPACRWLTLGEIAACSVVRIARPR